eukprot:COSAG02_NODE_37473_length_441_cov_1.128655_1_plen_48_part_10
MRPEALESLTKDYDPGLAADDVLSPLVVAVGPAAGHWSGACTSLLLSL